VEAFNTYDTQEARAALQNGLLSKLTGETILQWSEPFVSSALSLDGSKVAWGNETGLVQVQQTENKKVVTVRNRGERPVRGLAFSRESEVVAGVDENGVIRLWNAGLGTPLNFLLRGRPDIVTLAFNEAAVRADGSILASAGTPNRAIYLWDLKTQTNFIPDSLTISATGRRRVSALAWSEDGSQLAAGYAGGSVHVFSKDGWKETLSPEGLTGVVSALAWSPDGKQLAAGGADPGQGNNLLLWELGSTEQPAVFFLAGHTSTVTSAAFSPDGKTLASADSAGIVRLWDPATREPAGKPLESLGAGVLSLAFSPNGNQLYAVTERGTVIRWDLRALSKNTSPEILKELACQQAGRPGLTQVEWNSLFPTQNYRSTCGGPDAAAVPLGTPAPTPTATPAP
jgi:WD40 repeat protein